MIGCRPSPFGKDGAATSADLSTLGLPHNDTGHPRAQFIRGEGYQYVYFIFWHLCPKLYRHQLAKPVDSLMNGSRLALIVFPTRFSQ
jgi:hypothetical protein